MCSLPLQKVWPLVAISTLKSRRSRFIYYRAVVKNFESCSFWLRKL